MASQPDFGNSLDLVDIKEIRDGVVILKDGSLRQIIMVGGVNFALKSDGDQSVMIHAYENFLNGIDFSLQVVVHSRKVNIDAYTDELLKRKDVETSPIIQNQIDEYAQFIRGFVEKNAIMEKMFFVIVPFYPMSVLPPGSSGMFSFFKNKKGAARAAEDAKNKEDVEKSFRESLEQLGQRMDQAIAGLVSIGLDAEILTNDQLVELFYNFYNPQTIERKKIPETTTAANEK